MNPFSCILIGNESLTRECGAALIARGHRVAALVTRNPEVGAWARGQGLPVIAQEKGWEAALPAVDWLLSVANLSLVPEAALARASVHSASALAACPKAPSWIRHLPAGAGAGAESRDRTAQPTTIEGDQLSRGLMDGSRQPLPALTAVPDDPD